MRKREGDMENAIKEYAFASGAELSGIAAIDRFDGAPEGFHPRDIYKRVWKDEPYGAESTVAVHIRHLREKLEINPAEPRYIKAVWGQGYKMERVN